MSDANSNQPTQIAPPRFVILHYHLFKNAGTSVDAILKANFPNHWTSREFKTRPWAENSRLVEKWIRSEPDMIAFSSHTALFPVPRIEGVDILPVVFVRHPLDRIKSAYLFERSQQAETYGARLAKETDFAGYVRARIAGPKDTSLRNFQSRRLAMATPEDGRPLAERAISAAESLQFVGLVEAFEASMQRLAAITKPYAPEFSVNTVRKNVRQAENNTLKEKIGLIRRELDQSLYDRLVAENSSDFALYEMVCKNYGWQAEQIVF